MYLRIKKMDKQENEVSLFQTSGFSMWPFLKPCQKIIVKRLPATDLKLGDLILYRVDNQLVCHRFINRTKRNDGYFIYTHADASCLSQSEAIIEEKLYGKVIGIMKDNEIVNMERIGQRYINILIIIFAYLLYFGFKICRLLYRKK